MKKNWIVTIKCVVTKEVYCDNCTEDEVRNNPWGHASSDERELGMSDWEVSDWEVLSVDPNE